jgi:hypothetical protein
MIKLESFISFISGEYQEKGNAFINNITNYHATPNKTNNYLLRFKIKYTKL